MSALSTHTEILDKNKIGQFLRPQYQHYLEQLFIFQELESTNTYLTTLKDEHTSSPFICLAEKQTAGKGRLGRSWYSPYASNIYLSLLWHFKNNQYDLCPLSLSCAVAVVNALKAYGISAANGLQLKWPNDVLWQGRKLAGILIETFNVKSEPKTTAAVIGIGLNVNMQQDLNAHMIGQPWCDVAQIVGNTSPPCRNKLVGILLNELFEMIDIFEQHGFEPFIEPWQQLNIAKDKQVEIEISGSRIRGIGKGIDNHGRSLLKDTHGELHAINSSEVGVKS